MSSSTRYNKAFLKVGISFLVERLGIICAALQVLLRPEMKGREIKIGRYKRCAHITEPYLIIVSNATMNTDRQEEAVHLPHGV